MTFHHITDFQTIAGFNTTRVIAAAILSFACAVLATLCATLARRGDHGLRMACLAVSLGWCGGLYYFACVSLSLYFQPSNVARANITCGLVAFAIGLFYFSYFIRRYYAECSACLIYLGKLIAVRRGLEQEEAASSLGRLAHNGNAR